MESISELRKICQTTRPSIFSDFLSRFYYRVAIYFTWICLKLNLSANQVTVLSGVFAFIGGILIGTHVWGLVLLGTIFFHFFAILDMSDGEVARYRRQGGVSGHFLDWYMHFISSTSFMMGLFISSYDQLQNIFLIIIALIAMVIPLLDKSVQTAGWTVICWTRLRDLKKAESGPCLENFSSAENALYLPKWKRRLKFIFLVPFQDHWTALVLLILVLFEAVFSYLNLKFIDYKLLWLLYMGVIGPFYIFSRVKHLVQTPALKIGYQKLICPKEPIQLPKDDFLG